MTDKKVIEGFVCSSCGSELHEWHEVYYDYRAKLKRAGKLYISWCNKTSAYTVVDREI